MVEPVLALLRREVLHQRKPLGVRDVARDLAAQRAMADRLQPGLERLEHLLLAEIGELLAKALQVAERVLVNEADEAEELQKRVLQGSSRQEQFGGVGERTLEGVGDDVGRLVDIAEPVGFVDHHQIPRGVGYVGCLAAGKLVGADDDFVGFKWTEVALLDCGVVRLGLENPAGQEELFRHLLKPLLAQDSTG